MLFGFIRFITVLIISVSCIPVIDVESSFPDGAFLDRKGEKVTLDQVISLMSNDKTEWTPFNDVDNLFDASKQEALVQTSVPSTDLKVIASANQTTQSTLNLRGVIVASRASHAFQRAMFVPSTPSQATRPFQPFANSVPSAPEGEGPAFDGPFLPSTPELPSIPITEAHEIPFTADHFIADEAHVVSRRPFLPPPTNHATVHGFIPPPTPRK